jgi:hypothetical protein
MQRLRSRGGVFFIENGKLISWAVGVGTCTCTHGCLKLLLRQISRVSMMIEGKEKEKEESMMKESKRGRCRCSSLFTCESRHPSGSRRKHGQQKDT